MWLKHLGLVPQIAYTNTVSLYQIILVFIGGIFGGFYASSVGGGAFVSLPLLLFIGIQPLVALGTNRLSAVFLELTSAIRFNKDKKIDLRLALPLGLFASIGSVLGSVTAVHINKQLLNILIAVALLLAALALFYQDRFRSNKTTLNLALLVSCTVILGFYGGFFGAAFGVFMAITLNLFGFSLRDSAALSRVIGFCASSFAAIVFIKYNAVDYGLAISLGLGFAIGSWLGVGMVIKKGEQYIRAMLLIVITAYLIKSLFELL